MENITQARNKEALSIIYQHIQTINNRLQLIERDSDEAVSLVGQREALQEQFDALYDQLEEL